MINKCHKIKTLTSSRLAPLHLILLTQLRWSSIESTSVHSHLFPYPALLHTKLSFKLCTIHLQGLYSQCSVTPDQTYVMSWLHEYCPYSRTLPPLSHYTFSVSHIYLPKRGDPSDFSHKLVTGTEFNLPLPTIIKLENNQCKTGILEKRETNYMNFTINLVSWLEATCRSLCKKGISSRIEQYLWVERAKIRVQKEKGSWNLWGRDPEEEAMQRTISTNLCRVPLNMVLKYMVKLHQGGQKMSEEL